MRMTTATPADDQKAVLRRYLQSARDALLWKLEGLSEAEARRPLTPTGTNLLGVVKHTASTEAEYLGVCFGRPFPEPLPWLSDDAEDNADMWATPDQTLGWVADLYRRVQAHSDATIDALALDAAGHVPWWGDQAATTLQAVLVHMIAETARHTGQADIVRELVDGAVGLRADVSNLPDHDATWWASYTARLAAIADELDRGAERREILTWDLFGRAARALAGQVVASGWLPDVVVAVARGGLVPGGAVAYALGSKGVGTLNVEFYTDIGRTLDDPRVLPPFMDTHDLGGSRVLVVDDVADSGRTLELVLRMLAGHGAEVRSAVLYSKPRSIVRPDYAWRETDRWITFPWSAEPPVAGAGTAVG